MGASRILSLAAGAALFACSGDSSGPSPVVPPPGGQPTASFRFSCAELVCLFVNESRSVNPGAEASYAWQFGDGRTSTDEAPVHSFVSQGTYQVVLTVTDDRGRTGRTTRAVAVPVAIPSTQPPVSFTTSCESNRCRFVPEHLSDPLYLFSWNLGDGSTSNEPSPVHFYGGLTEPTTLTVRLTVWAWDGSANVSPVGAVSQQITVTPLPPPPPPTAAFTVSCSALVCTFTDQSVGGGLVYRWEFGDGATSIDRNPTHTYNVSAPTTFTVTLTVFDWDIASAVTTQQLTVTPPPPPVCGGPPDC